MTIGNATNAEPRVIALRFARNRLIVQLADDREVSIPLTHYPTSTKPAPPNLR